MYIHVHVNTYIPVLLYQGLNSLFCMCSVGEIGSRVKPGDDTLHTTVGNETLVSTDGVQTELLATPLQDSVTGKDNGDEELNSETFTIQRQEADSDQNQTLSEPETPTNEDSVTLTQSSSSVTALTLTEVTQMEGSQSLLKLDTHTTKPRSEQHTTTEALTEPLVSETSPDDGKEDDNNTEDGGGGVKEEVPQYSLESSQKLPSATESAGDQNPESNPHIIIGDIVRSEMRKILQVHLQYVHSITHVDITKCNNLC